jgi:AcrR family transcriptional regulator
VRNRLRIIEVGRRYVDDGIAIQLNDVAREASVGVATVYRHFPSPEALLESVAAPGLEHLASLAEAALGEADPWAAFRGFLLAAVTAQVSDPSIAAVMAAPPDGVVLASTDEHRRRLAGLFGRLLDRVHSDGLADSGLTSTDVGPLICGADAGGVRRYLSAMLGDLRTERSPAPRVETA